MDVKRNLVWLLLSQSATWALTLVSIVVVPRVLGTEEFGTVSYAVVFVNYFGLIAGFELAPLITRTIARDHSTFGSLVVNGVVVRLVFTFVVSVVALGLAILLGLSNQLVVLVAIGCAGLFVANVNNVLTAALAGVERIGRPAMWATVQLYVGGFAAIVAVLIGGGIFWYAAVFAVAGLIPLVANSTMVRPQLQHRPDLDHRVRRTLVRGGLPLVVLTALIQFYGNIDYPVLEWLGGLTAVGWYSVAYKLAGISFFIATAVVAAYFPRLSALAPAGGRPFAEATNTAVSLVVLVSVPFAFGLCAVADDVIRLLYDDTFTPAIPVLRVLALQVPLTAINTVLGTALMAQARVRRFVYVAALACVFTPIGMYVAIRSFSDGPSRGGVGAALVTTLTEVLVLVGSYVLAAPGVLDWATISRCLRSVVAGACILPVLWVLDGWPLVTKPVLAIVTYMAVVIALRVVTVQDLRAGADFVGRMIRRRDDPASADDHVEQIDHG